MTAVPVTYHLIPEFQKRRLDENSKAQSYFWTHAFTTSSIYRTYPCRDTWTGPLTLGMGIVVYLAASQEKPILKYKSFSCKYQQEKIGILNGFTAQTVFSDAISSMLTAVNTPKTGRKEIPLLLSLCALHNTGL